MNEFQRSSGVLLHVSSLPSKHGIGDFGKDAYRWVDFLDAAGVEFWQILPLNPTGYGNSPYQGLSAFAGNPLFIDLDELVTLGLLAESDFLHRPRFRVSQVDFEKVIVWKRELLEKAYINYLSNKLTALKNEHDQFGLENQEWLHDFSVFMALRERHGLKSWKEWPRPLRMRHKQALMDFERDHQHDIGFHGFLQFLFARQIAALKAYANEKGIRIIGDIPIFMGYDCADVWAYPQLFDLDKDRLPTAVAGVPPDFFSSTGQLWGNPLYKWSTHKSEGYSWWTRRVTETLKTVDLIRLDHFRGFAGYYRIPAGETTAENGKWVKGPGFSLFDALQENIGSLPFIAEDLGVITPDVIALRERYHFPGMRLLQFSFWDNADHEFLPHNYPINCVVYTGTHDNDTTVHWYKCLPRHEKRFCRSYLGNHISDIAHEMIRTIWRSNALVAIAPMQDFLRLDGWARMNLPASTQGNWLWRMRPGASSHSLAAWIKKINITYNRTMPAKDWPAEKYFAD